MSPTLGDMNPDFARRLGLADDQLESLKEEAPRWDGKVFPATLVEPPPRPDGKRDPVAFMPPDFRTWGIIDRDHRNRVKIGETWFVEAYQRASTTFLVPLFRVDLEHLLGLQPARLQELAAHLARSDPTLVKHLIEKLPAAPKPEVDKEMAALRQRATELTQKLNEVVKQKAAVETEVENLRSRPAAAPAPAAPAVARPLLVQPEALRSAAGFPGLPPRDATLTRTEGDRVESPSLIHSAYDAHFTGDLYSLVLRPSAGGTPCDNGAVIVRGLSRVDASPPPVQYPMAWDDRLGGFVVYIGRARG